MSGKEASRTRVDGMEAIVSTHRTTSTMPPVPTSPRERRLRAGQGRGLELAEGIGAIVIGAMDIGAIVIGAIVVGAIVVGTIVIGAIVVGQSR